VLTHKLVSAQSCHSCDLNFVVKGEGLLKVTGNHVHWKSGNISKTVLGRNVVTTGSNSPTRIRPI